MSGESVGHVADPANEYGTRRGHKGRSLSALLVAQLLIAFWLLLPSQVHAFGTINGLGQRAEHERITRAALACPPGVKSTGDCFEPRSIDQLAGHTGTFGAVGAPDIDETSNPAAHCDDADFLNVAGYPQTRGAASAALLACVAHLRTDFQHGIDGANGLFDSDGELVGSEVDLKTDCTFAGGFAGRAKCNALEGLGRALHGAQDFYSHSNWADEADPTRAIGVNNPPGLNLPGPSPILDLAGTSTPAIPTDLTTGFYAGIVGDATTVCTGLLSGLNTRVTHACLNKDQALINPVSGTATDPHSTRGLVLSNEQKAVSGAIAETQRQWADFRASLISRYGSDVGGRMVLALTQDVPKVDLVFAIDTTGSMGPHIAGAIAAANDVVDALSGRGTPPILTDYRVGIVDYKDVDSDPAFGCPPDYDAVTDLPFSTKRTDIVSALGTLRFKVFGGCDFPEDVLSGVQRAVDFPWRDGVSKAIIVMGDAPGHDPENHSGLTTASVTAAALAVDPAIIYPILVGPFGAFGTDAFMAALAAGTGGQTFDGRSGGVAPALLAAITAIVTAPVSHATNLTTDGGTQDYNDPATLTAHLTDAGTGTGLAGKLVTITIDAQSCSGTTDGSGTATCSITPNEQAGTYPSTATFAGDADFDASSASSTFTVTKEETTLAYTGTTGPVKNGSTATLSGVLKEDGTTAISGRTVSFTFGSQSCSGATDASGTASCTVTVDQPLGAAAITAGFAGDAWYLPATDNANAVDYTLVAKGSFAIGDNTATGTVTFFGERWDKKNDLSGGRTPDEFDGWVPSVATPACGMNWSISDDDDDRGQDDRGHDDHGHSSPPRTVPAYFAVIVSSSIKKTRNKIKGDTVHVVIVKTTTYTSSHNGNGTGTVVATVC